MYQPRPLPANPSLASLAQHVSDELQQIARGGGDTVDFVQLNVLHASPKKPRDGMVVCADGTNWQPLGAGGGFFGRFGGAWVKLNN